MLENKFQSCINSNERVENECLLCDQLRAKVSNLEAERENLLAVIQLLTEEKQSRTVKLTQSIPKPKVQI